MKAMMLFAFISLVMYPTCDVRRNLDEKFEDALLEMVSFTFMA